jgi:hypothetical protein
MDTFEFPIKFEQKGIKKLEDGSYDYFKQMLTISLLTEPGEHPITPEFGVLDPSFTPIEPADFVINAAKFIPEVEIITINPSIDKTDGGVVVDFSFRVVR